MKTERIDEAVKEGVNAHSEGLNLQSLKTLVWKRFGRAFEDSVLLRSLGRLAQQQLIIEQEDRYLPCRQLLLLQKQAP